MKRVIKEKFVRFFFKMYVCILAIILFLSKGNIFIAQKFICYSLKIFFKISIKGLDNIPINGGGLICSKHVSALDMFIISYNSPRKINFMAKKSLFDNIIISKALRYLGAFPNKPDINSIRTAIRKLKNNELVGIFPEGTRIKDQQVSKINPGAIKIASILKVPIIPVTIKGDFRLFGKITVIFKEKYNVNSKDDIHILMDDLRRRINE